MKTVKMAKTPKSFKGLKIWSLQEPKSRKGVAVKNYLELLTKIKIKFPEEILGQFYLFWPMIFLVGWLGRQKEEESWMNALPLCISQVTNGLNHVAWRYEELRKQM